MLRSMPTGFEDDASATATCSFTISPVTATRQCDGSKQNVNFQANISSGCSVASSASSASAVGNGKVDIDDTDSFFEVNAFGTPIAHVFFFAGPGRSGDTAGTITVSMALKFNGQSQKVQKSTNATITCQ